MTTPRMRSAARVKDYMTAHVITVTVPNNRRAALKIFLSHPISGIPVVKDGGELIGIITRKNIFDRPSEEQLAMLMVRNPITIRDSDTVADAARLMYDKRIHRLPVLDKDEKLVGIISPIDCLEVLQELKTGEVVETYLSPNCVAIHEDTPARAALSILEAGRVKALPVIDKKGDVTGIVTDRDLYSQAKIDQRIIETDLGEGIDEDKWTWEGLRNIAKLYIQTGELELPTVAVKTFMVKNPVTVYGKSSLEKAARHMVKGRFNQLPVTWPNGKLRGVVNELDILRYLWE